MAVAAAVMAGCGASGTVADPQPATHPGGTARPNDTARPGGTARPGPVAVRRASRRGARAAGSTTSTIPRARPQAVDPTAGQASPRAPLPAATTIPGDAASGTGSSDPEVTGPASVTSAPARDAPTDTQVRAALARLETVEQRYQLGTIDVSGALLNPAELQPGRWYRSIASFYTLFGNHVACGGVMHPWTLGVANKTLPCGTAVIFQYGNRAIEVHVIDRGPYVAGREWDLTAATAVALHFPGLGPVRWRLASGSQR